jgi:hypothetical protein
MDDCDEAILYSNVRKRMKLLSIKKSSKPDKKFMAEFEKDGRKKIVHFGMSGADDFTLTGDEKQKELYLLRHRARENWNEPDTAGALARWILWNKPTLTASIADFRRRFSL